MRLENKIKRKITKTVKASIGLQKKPIPRNNFSKRTIEEIRKFQHGYCAVNGCNIRKLLEHDHIRGRDNSSAENCQLLCPFHHRQKTRRDAKRKQIAKKIKSEELSLKSSKI